MEFWGVEVPAGKPSEFYPGDGMYLHVSQAALGESKDKSGKGNARVVLKVKVDDSDVVLGTLSEGKCDQMPLDLVFDREFTVSHNGTSSSVYLCGYRTEGPEYDSEDEEDDFEDLPEALPLEVKTDADANGAREVKLAKAAKTEGVAKKAAEKVQAITNAAIKEQKKALKKQVVESSSDDEDESDDEDGGLGNPFVSEFASESDDEFDAGDDSDEDMDEDDDDEDDDEEDDEDEFDESEEEEVKLEAPKPGKKRAAEELAKSAEKKSKTDASPKPGTEAAAEYWQGLIAAGSQGQALGKKGKEGKAAPVTPIGKAGAAAEVKTPTDKGSKPAKAPKGTPTAPPTTPVSEKKIGQHKCAGCDRTFMTESAMSQHAAAKHGAAKA